MNFTKLIIVGLVLLTLAGCNVNAAKTGARFVIDGETFDRRAMLKNIVETSILPPHKQVVVETEALQQAAYALRDEPNGPNLAALQAQWRATARAWARVEHLGFRFTMVVHNQIKKQPPNTGFIEEFVATETEPVDEPFIESLGSTSKGLAALEYLIFDPVAGDDEILQALTAEPRRLAYTVALAENVNRKARALEAMWSPEGDNQARAFIEADFSADNVQGSLNMLANEMIAGVEEIANDRLNYPRKGVYGRPQPQAVESAYAQFSVPLMADNLRGLQQTFKAGLADYLDFLQAGQADPPLSAAINQQFEQAIAAVEAISPSLQTAVIDDPAAVEQAYNEVKDLLVLFKVDMANQMGLTVTFSDNDGD